MLEMVALENEDRTGECQAREREKRERERRNEN
jgi:hypothetical protein